MAKKSRRSQRKGGKAYRKDSRKASRKASRKGSRKGNKGRKNTRKGQRGGAYDPQRLSFLQGMEYRELHPAQFEQKGGAMLGYAPVTPGDQGLLDASLRQMARVTPLDASDDYIKGMRDPPFDTMPVKQTGGARRRKASKKSRRTSIARKAMSLRKQANRKASKKSRKASKKSRKGSRRQRGGALLNGAPLSQPTMLLTPAQAAKAGTGDFSNPLLRD
jgi:hypothetical protein